VELRRHVLRRLFRLWAVRPCLTRSESKDGGADQQDERSANMSQPTQRQFPPRRSTAPGDWIVANVESGVKRSRALRSALRGAAAAEPCQTRALPPNRPRNLVRQNHRARNPR
jgi:hypothetical protein